MVCRGVVARENKSVEKRGDGNQSFRSLSDFYLKTLRLAVLWTLGMLGSWEERRRMVQRRDDVIASDSECQKDHIQCWDW